MALEDIIYRIAEMIGEGIAILHNRPDLPDPARVVWVNDAFTRMTGYALKDVEGMTPLQLHAWHLSDVEMRDIAARIRVGAPWRSIMRCGRKDKTLFWGDVSITPITDDSDPGNGYLIHVYRNVDPVVERETALEEARAQVTRNAEEVLAAQARLSMAMDTIPDSFAIYDSEDRLVSFNRAYSASWTDDPSQVRVGMTLREVHTLGMNTGKFPVPPHKAEKWFASITWPQPGEHEVTDMIFQNERYGRVYKSVGRNGDKVLLRMDITELKQQQIVLERYAEELERAKAEIEHQALHDALSGLGNRRYLQARLDEMLAERGAAGDEVAILHIDLDRFKQINDTMGHAAGDHVLRSVAQALRRLVSEGQHASRIGGDEFVVAMRCAAGSDAPQILAQQIVDDLARPVIFEGKECRFGASVGVARMALDGADANELMVQSDIALYRAKQRGRTRLEVFDASLMAEMQETKRLADRILKGLDTKAFVPFYQPQFDARTEELLGVEVLARWDTGGEILPPHRFLPVAEDLHVVGDIDRMIFEAAIAECTALVGQGALIPKLSFNVSPERIADKAFLLSARRAQLFPGDVAFELLESIFVEEEGDEFAFVLDGLREQGIGIEVDDFGSGRASIVALTRIAPDRLKIDRRLVQPITVSAQARALVNAIVDIGRAMDIAVTAEGVETAEQAVLLRDMGCTAFQGFYYARPMPGPELAGFITARAWARTAGIGAPQKAAGQLPR